MSKILTDVDAFSADVTVPEDGEARDAASVEPAFQKLANRSRYLKNLMELLKPLTPATVVRWIPGSSGSASDDAGNAHGWLPGVSVSYYGAAVSTGVARAERIYDVSKVVPNGATITQIRVRVDPVAAQATDTNRMSAKIHVSDSTGVLSSSAVVYGDATDAAQWIVIPSLALVVDKTARSYEVAVRNSVNYALDIIYGVEVTFTTLKNYVD